MARHGDQTPTYSWCTSYVRSQGDVAIALSKAYSLDPHPWQRTVLTDWLAMDENGRYLNPMCLLPSPRQNGKTGVLEPRETYGLIVRGERILHTSHEYQSSRVGFDRLREKFGECTNDPRAKFPELNRLVRKYTVSQGQMVLDLTNGGHIEFRTRGSSGDVGRGGTFDLIVVDEAQSYTDAQDAALAALNVAAPSGSPQTILTGTVPDPEKPYKGEVFRRLRTAAHEEPYDGMCIHEWAADDVGDPHDEDRWYRYNPSLGYQLLVTGLRKDSRSMTPEKFAQEHLGWWGAVIMSANPIDYAKWRSCAVSESTAATIRGREAYAVKFAPDGERYAVAVCVVPNEGAPYVEVTDMGRVGGGMSELVRFLKGASERGVVVVDGQSNAQTCCDALRDAGVMRKRIVRPTSQDMISACTALVDAVRSRNVCHMGQEPLDEAAKECGRRRIGTAGGYGFADSKAGDSTLLEAVALALWQGSALKRRKRTIARYG